MFHSSGTVCSVRWQLTDIHSDTQVAPSVDWEKEAVSLQSVCVCVWGCAAVLLSTQARGSCSTGSVQRDGGKKETEREREREDGWTKDTSVWKREQSRNHVTLQICSSFPSVAPTFLPLFPFISWSRYSSPSIPLSGRLYNHSLICLGSYYNEHSAAEQGGKRREVLLFTAIKYFHKTQNYQVN